MKINGIKIDGVKINRMMRLPWPTQTDAPSIVTVKPKLTLVPEPVKVRRSEAVGQFPICRKRRSDCCPAGRTLQNRRNVPRRTFCTGYCVCTYMCVTCPLNDARDGSCEHLNGWRVPSFFPVSHQLGACGRNSVPSSPAPSSLAPSSLAP